MIVATIILMLLLLRDDTIEHLSALDPLYILYTSGTTGELHV